MRKRRGPLSPEEVTELFSKLDASGALDPTYDRPRAARRRLARERRRAALHARLPWLPRWHRERVRADRIDPLSADDPSGSTVGHTISHVAIGFVGLIFVLILGMQVFYGIARRLHTKNLSDLVTVERVRSAMADGLEWGRGFTQFPHDFTVDQADERAGVVEVSVTDTGADNEQQLLSNGQIQGAALATNALLNSRINRVVYNVWAFVDDDGTISHTLFFGMIPAQGSKREILTFIWTKHRSSTTNEIDWEMRIIGIDEEIASRIQNQVNSVSSLIAKPGISEGDLESEEEERSLDQALKGSEVFGGGVAEKSAGDVIKELRQRAS